MSVLHLFGDHYIGEKLLLTSLESDQQSSKSPCKAAGIINILNAQQIRTIGFPCTQHLGIRAITILGAMDDRLTTSSTLHTGEEPWCSW